MGGDRQQGEAGRQGSELASVRGRGVKRGTKLRLTRARRWLQSREASP